MISLKDIGMNNFSEVIHLPLEPSDQQNVATNMYSMAEAYADQVSICKGIYNDLELIGFTMYDYNPVERKGYVSRLMITTKAQGKGFGTSALELVIHELKKNTGIETIQISYSPGNVKAKQSYAKCGFIENGEVTNGEVVAIYEIE